MTEDGVEADGAVAERGEIVIRGEKVRIGRAHRVESGELVLENREHQSGVQFGIALSAGLQPPVLVVLDEVVIRIAGKGQGIKPERVYGRIVQSHEAGPGGRQVRDVVP